MNLTASMPTPTEDTYVLMFGRFDRGYILRDRTPLTMSFDQITKPGFGWCVWVVPQARLPALDVSSAQASKRVLHSSPVRSAIFTFQPMS